MENSTSAEKYKQQLHLKMLCEEIARKMNDINAKKESPTQTIADRAG